MMDSSQPDETNKSSPDETSSDSSISLDSPDSNDIFREPLVHPRVGDEYQVEIPFLLNKSEFFTLMNPFDSETIKDSSRYFLIGLPVPVMWIYNQENFTKQSTTNEVVESEINMGMIRISTVDEGSKVKIDASNQTRTLVPGQSSVLWSDFEADCFLLGLYIFGKNFVQVSRFMETKRVGEILSYYYGRFYGSNGYRRWSECRKMRNRKCVLGYRFFTGYRQHELFARLGPHLSEESRTKYMEVSRAFVEGRTTVEEYISSLKSLVGIQALVEAMGIGKEKNDISTLIFDGSRNSQLFSQRPEIPSGKACSSLTCSELVKYLTGDFRLSKARSNDLFWEAVWPRLLARGWHSEQPRGENYTGSKNCLVFLMPGVKKFSRRRLSKGDHYFDSVSDVLAKVASEPELLELDVDQTRPNNSEAENGWAIDVKSDDDDHDHDRSDQERHCYLKPRVSSEISNLFKFTVVDTSLTHENNPSKVRELRSLPIEAKKCLSFRKSDNTMRNGLQKSSNTSNYLDLGANNDANLPKDHKSRTIKHQFSRRIKPGPTSCSSGQVVKKRRLGSRREGELAYVLCLPAKTEKIKNKGKNVSSFKVTTTNEIVPSKVIQSNNVKVTSTKTLVGGTSDLISNFHRENEKLTREPKIIDLNLPHVEPESEGRVNLGIAPESDVKIKIEVSDINKRENSDAKEQLVSCNDVGTTSKGVDPVDQQQPRRQSTRNRPLTTKALEALEIGFLNPERHSRKRSLSTTQEQKSKRSRQPRSKNSAFPPNVEFEVQESVDGNCNGKIPENLGDKISIEKDTMNCDLLVLPESSFPPTPSSKAMFA